MVYLAVVAVVLIVLLLPAVSEMRRKPVSDQERGTTTGDIAILSQGATHYRWAGPTRGPIAVVIHGVATSSVAVEGLAAGLGDLGYRVLIYDLYGRGLSDAVPGRQDRAFFIRQLTELLAYLGQTEEITVCGFSMGGAIATAFAAENPHYVKRLILIAPACVVQQESRFSRFCRRTPILGNFLHAWRARKRALKTIPKPGDNAMANAVFAAQRKEIQRRGYLPAVLSSRRGILSEVQERDHRRLGRLDIPTIAIWAEKDEAIPIQALGVLAQWHRNVRHEVVSGAGHAMPYTHCPQLLSSLSWALKSD